MTPTEVQVELSFDEFRSLVQQEFSFLNEQFGFPAPLFWEFGGNCYVSFDDGETRIETWCGKREACVWTLIERQSIGRCLGLDTWNALTSAGPEYPPFMGNHWTDGETEKRLQLEGEILRANVPSLLEDTSVFEEAGDERRSDAVALDDPEQTFARRCEERFRFLEDEFGLARELDGFGETVLYRGPSNIVRISLLNTAYEHEDEPQPTLSIEVAPLQDGHFPPPFVDTVEVEIPERPGPFTAEYLEQAFDHAEQALRSGESTLRAR